MNIQHVNAKLFFDSPFEIGGPRVVGVFHDWVREQVFDEVLIDVADYRHVPNGPSLMIIGLEADYVVDDSDGRMGLLYNRKAGIDGSNVDRFKQAIDSAANAALLLKETLGDKAPMFSQTEFQWTVNDRAIAPNTPETFAAFTSDLVASATAILGHSEFTLKHHDDPRRLFSVTVSTIKSFDFAEIA